MLKSHHSWHRTRWVISRRYFFSSLKDKRNFQKIATVSHSTSTEWTELQNIWIEKSKFLVIFRSEARDCLAEGRRWLSRKYSHIHLEWQKIQNSSILTEFPGRLRRNVRLGRNTGSGARHVFVRRAPVQGRSEKWRKRAKIQFISVGKSVFFHCLYAHMSNLFYRHNGVRLAVKKVTPVGLKGNEGRPWLDCPVQMHIKTR